MPTMTPHCVDRSTLATVCKVHPRSINRALGQPFNRDHRDIDFAAFCAAVNAEPTVILAAINGTDELLSVRELARLWQCERDEARYLTNIMPFLKRVARIGGSLRFSKNAARSGCIGGVA